MGFFSMDKEEERMPMESKSLGSINLNKENVSKNDENLKVNIDITTP